MSMLVLLVMVWRKNIIITLFYRTVGVPFHQSLWQADKGLGGKPPLRSTHFLSHAFHHQIICMIPITFYQLIKNIFGVISNREVGKY